MAPSGRFVEGAGAGAGDGGAKPVSGALAGRVVVGGATGGTGTSGTGVGVGVGVPGGAVVPGMVVDGAPGVGAGVVCAGEVMVGGVACACAAVGGVVIVGGVAIPVDPTGAPTVFPAAGIGARPPPTGLGVPGVTPSCSNGSSTALFTAAETGAGSNFGGSSALVGLGTALVAGCCAASRPAPATINIAPTPNAVALVPTVVLLGAEAGRRVLLQHPACQRWQEAPRGTVGPAAY